MSELSRALQRAREALAAALPLAEARRDEQARAVEAAEFGPHGRSDVVAAETELHDRWLTLVERLAGLAHELGELNEEVEAL